MNGALWCDHNAVLPQLVSFIRGALRNCFFSGEIPRKQGGGLPNPNFPLIAETTGICIFTKKGRGGAHTFKVK